MSQSKLDEILMAYHNINHSTMACRSAILELFKSAVPEEHSGTRDYATAWNNCRTETLRNMNEL